MLKKIIIATALFVAGSSMSATEPARNVLGEGSQTTTLTVRWGDDVAIDNLASTVKFNGTATVGDIITTALAEDPRFYALKDGADSFVAFGFDTNGDNSAAISVGGALELIDGVAVTADDYSAAKGSSDYDHWKVNSDATCWKIFVNNAEATCETTVATGDDIVLEYTAADATTPTERAYTFFLRPATQQGVWMLPEVVMNTADGKQTYVPMIANWLGDGNALYGACVATETYDVDGVTVNNASYGCYIANAKKGAMSCRVSVTNPVEALIRPYLNIRKDWGDGKQSVKRVYGDCDTHISTIVAHPMTGIGLEGIEPGSIIELDNMGTKIIQPFYEPADADFTGFTFTSSDFDVVSFYSNVNTLVAHKEGTATITIASKDGNVSRQYVVNVKGIDPDNRPHSFTDGMIWLNEEWFTHTSGSLNFIDPEGNIYYRAYANQNDNKAFGATSQFGMMYADKLFIMSKQDWDNGDTRDRGEQPDRSGGRVVVIDANTMQRLVSYDVIGGDGRAAVGIEPGKVYLSHSKGVRVLTWDEDNNFTLADADLPMLEAATSAHGGTGDMVKVGKYVFAAEVDKAFHVFDTETDAEVFKITANKANMKAQGVVQTKDGRVWLGCDKTLLPINVDEFDPTSYETNIVAFADFMPEGQLSLPVGKLSGCSSSWRHANLMTSHVTNVLMWGDGDYNGSGGSLFRWDLDNGGIETTRTVYTHDKKGEFGYGYGSPGYDPLTDTYMFASMPGFGAKSLQNWYHFIDATTGELKHRVKLPEYWWFPAMPIILDRYEPEMEDLPVIVLSPEAGETSYDLNVSDRDNLDCNIRVSLQDNGTAADTEAGGVVAEARVEGHRLFVTPKKAGNRTLALAVESNGKVVTKNVEVRIETTGIDNVTSDASADVEYYDMSGIKISKPQAGQIVIRRTGDKYEKIRF